MRRRIPLMCLTGSLLLSFLSACGGGGVGGDLTTEGITVPSDTDDTGEAVTDAFKGIFLNIDGSTVSIPFFQSLLEQKTVTEEDLYPYIDQYVGTQVTDIAINIGGQLSVSRSDVWTDMVERYLTREIYGKEVYFEYLKPVYEMYETHGLDPIGIWLSRIREQGLKAWVTIRMNDCHDPYDPYVWVHGEAYYESRENGWMIGSDYGYYGACFNYAVEEVRQHELRYLEEQVMRYDVDGVELDFSREWYCFDYSDGKDHAAIMTQFMRDVNAVIASAEETWGHDIKINIRLMRDIEQNLAFGFDAAAYVSEKLVDAITVCPRWATCDSDMPIEAWKEAFPDFPIYAGVTDLIYNQMVNYPTIAGYASQYFERGADKLYLFNIFNNPAAPIQAYEKIYQTCGSIDTLLETPQRHIVTYQDMAPPGKTAWKPLPAKADGFSLDIVTGPIPEGETVWLIVGVNDKLSKGDLTIKINGQEISFKSMTKFSALYAGDAEQYRYRVPAEYCTDGIQTVELATEDDSLILKYLELTVGINLG